MDPSRIHTYDPLSGYVSARDQRVTVQQIDFKGL